MYFGRFLGVLIMYSKMVNLGFRTTCNILLDIFGAAKNLPKMDPGTPHLLHKYFKRIRNVWKHFVKLPAFAHMGI